MDDLKRLLNEIILLIHEKKISKSDMAEGIKVSRPYLNKILDNKGRTEDFAALLDFCRKYKPLEK